MDDNNSVPLIIHSILFLVNSWKCTFTVIFTPISLKFLRFMLQRASWIFPSISLPFLFLETHLSVFVWRCLVNRFGNTVHPPTSLQPWFFDTKLIGRIITSSCINCYCSFSNFSIVCVRAVNSLDSCSSFDNISLNSLLVLRECKHIHVLNLSLNRITFRPATNTLTNIFLTPLPR